MLAIIIPYYKLTFFENTLESLQNQTNKQFKVYIGDDASPENPILLLEKFKEKIDFVYHRFESNLGGTSLTQQWERCIYLSKEEEWLMILGDDDALEKNVVDDFYKNLPEVQRTNITVVRYASQLINEDSEIISGVHMHPKIEKSTDFIIKKINNQVRSSLSEYIFKKELVLKIGFKNFPLAWYSDDLAVLEFSNFKNVYTINGSIVFVRLSSLSISCDNTTIKRKNKSRFEFLYFLLNHKSNYFTKIQLEILYAKIAKSYINEKTKFNYFFKITFLSFKFGWLLKYFEFLRTICYYTLIKMKR
jgi:glycosyltransferase involved in cell wall biosynthesis